MIPLYTMVTRRQWARILCVGAGLIFGAFLLGMWTGVREEHLLEHRPIPKEAGR